MKILVIIPAKLDSKRLANKNIQMIDRIPMFMHSVNYARKSKYDNMDIIVSSESNIVQDICNDNNVQFHKRPKILCGDVEVVDVYEYIINNLSTVYDIVIGLQPDNPNRVNTIDECIDYMIDNKYDDVITVDETYRRSGAMRLFKYDFLKQGKVSYRIGCLKETATDIHTEQDLNKVKEYYK